MTVGDIHELNCYSVKNNTFFLYAEPAKDAKSAGDDFYRKNKWLEARDAYARAASLFTTDPDLQKSILLNLAAANLQLENWDEVLRDTATVLQTDEKSIKALYRSARALDELERFEEAIDCCKRGLKLEPHNKSLQEECHMAQRGYVRLQQYFLLTAYSHHQMYILPTSRMTSFASLPSTHPHEIPYFDPPTPSDPLTAPMLCMVRFRYIERFASDTAAEFPTDKPLLPLLETFLPGTTKFAKPSRTQNNLTFVPSGNASSIQHPTDWDPRYEFLPSTVSVYAQTRRGEIILIKDDMTLFDLFEEVRRLSNGNSKDERTHIELRRGMIHLFTFRKGSATEKKWKDGKFKNPTKLGDPKYQVSPQIDSSTDKRSRHFCYGDPKGRSVNMLGSPSWNARAGILNVLYSRRGDEGVEETDPDVQLRTVHLDPSNPFSILDAI
ncbi:hypothetical protein FRC09_007116 [Ceratobasidium sp. 395]|nr:hypothetical protein FRC09_007116 [Ceratobasidium sp. 395]